MAETQVIPADAVERSWVDGAPLLWQPYLRLARLDRPIGTWLLFWPCVFGLALGAATQQRGLFSVSRDWWLLLLFAVGAIVMRGAGCTYNDIVDREIDARVERTRGRPIPSGAITVKQAWQFTAAQSAIGFVILLCLNGFSIALGVLSLILIALYPFMKRVTWWPQAWLGITFNWGALLGFAALADRTSAADLVLYAGCFFWTLGYDTIYALQDIDDDALAGVKSTALLFGRHARTWVLLFYLLAFGFFAAAAGFGLRSRFAALFLLPVLAHFLWQVRRLELDDPALCLKLFRANRDAGALIALALFAGSWFAARAAA
ncbi:MAG TPA: 4-hydroxybenzoate octaprenyltransferase [Rhizomicrobium sp.]|nr:4-hydroxybenzoate octaprenyltransferase [Rhizomicrobium sp.]